MHVHDPSPPANGRLRHQRDATWFRAKRASVTSNFDRVLTKRTDPVTPQTSTMDDTAMGGALGFMARKSKQRRAADRARANEESKKQETKLEGHLVLAQAAKNDEAARAAAAQEEKTREKQRQAACDKLQREEKFAAKGAAIDFKFATLQLSEIQRPQEYKLAVLVATLEGTSAIGKTTVWNRWPADTCRSHWHRRKITNIRPSLHIHFLRHFTYIS